MTTLTCSFRVDVDATAPDVLVLSSGHRIPLCAISEDDLIQVAHEIGIAMMTKARAQSREGEKYDGVRS